MKGKVQYFVIRIPKEKEEEKVQCDLTMIPAANREEGYGTVHYFKDPLGK